MSLVVVASKPRSANNSRAASRSCSRVRRASERSLVWLEASSFPSRAALVASCSGVSCDIAFLLVKPGFVRVSLRRSLIYQFDWLTNLSLYNEYTRLRGQMSSRGEEEKENEVHPHFSDKGIGQLMWYAQ